MFYFSFLRPTNENARIMLYFHSFERRLHVDACTPSGGFFFFHKRVVVSFSVIGLYARGLGGT